MSNFVKCMQPHVLKSGLVVSCGRCELCLAQKRNEWSIRLQLECKCSNRMPLFVTLTYNDDNLPFMDRTELGKMFRGCKKLNDDPELAKYYSDELYRPDVSAFLKEYKRKYKLTNDKFMYFGCGERGDKLGRPHYHLLFFGDDELYRLYDESTEKAQKHVEDVWKYGFCHVCIAGFDGVHYVTKYVLKDSADYETCLIKPFTISSNNLGQSWLQSEEAYRLERSIHKFFQEYKGVNDKIYYVPDNIPQLNQLVLEMESWLPKMTASLVDGTEVYLPRYFRKRLLGSFQHFKDNPFWFYNHIRNYRDALIYIRDFGKYDCEHDLEYWKEVSKQHIIKIRTRLYEKKRNNLRTL